MGHGTGRFHQCEICFKSFRDRAKLKRHAVVHTKEKPFACDICLLRYTTPGNLSAHVKLKHPNN